MYVDDESRLRHMLDAASEAAGFARDRSRADLAGDRLLALGLVKLIEIVGEAASKITPEFRDAHPGIPWRRIIDMRHVLVHDYDRVNLEIVWEVAAVRMGELVEALAPLVPPWQEPD
jgi:uncharacterized protein with HEPN domain